MGSNPTSYITFWETGDLESFKLLVDEFTVPLHYFASNILGNSQEAEEVVSDVLMKIWQQRSHLPDQLHFKFYLYKAVKNTALNYLKRKGRQTAGHAGWEILVDRHGYQNPEDTMISKEHLGLIRSAIASLPPRCRQIFILVKEEGLTYEQVAALLDISKATVNVQITLALKKIWSTLDPVLRLSRS